VTLNPPGQYADDRNLRARQRFWQHQDPYFDVVGWVLDLAALSPGMRVLDAGCGNGLYLRGLRDRQVTVVGCDRSLGMLQAAAHPALLGADVTALPLRDGVVDVALAIHMLYHVPDRETAIRELRRVVVPGGTCIAVTNGDRHTRSLRALIERAVRRETPGWQMRPATHAFTAENAAVQLGAAFEAVTCIRPASAPPVVIRDAAVAADYVASLATHHHDGTARPWEDVAEDVRQQVQLVIDDQGAFITSSDLAAFICRRPPAAEAALARSFPANRYGRARTAVLSPEPGELELAVPGGFLPGCARGMGLLPRARRTQPGAGRRT